jgi:hypothetical protein
VKSSFVTANPGTRFVLRSYVHRSAVDEAKYDPNAIRVDNVLGQQIGHIPRTVAAKLAPYLVSSGKPTYA